MTTQLATERVLALIDDVPEVARFPTVDELNDQLDAIERAHDTVTKRRIGSSRLGEPLYGYTVGEGERHALIIGGVHPNEPIGGPTTAHLLRTLAADDILRTELGYTWHVIGCVDPDGMRLNEGWFAGDLDRGQYGRRFFRPASDEQVEWTFPLQYKELYFDRVMPETLALMRLIDEIRPTFLCSLHNGELGGVYYYVSHDAPELYPALHAVPQALGIPLDRGEPEAPFVPQYAPAVFGEVGVEAHYEYAVSLGLDPASMLDSGASSGGYAARYNTFLLVSELPYWSHPDAADDSPTTRSYREVLRERGAGLDELGRIVTEVLETTAADRRLNSPFLRAMRQFAPHFVATGEQDDRRAAQPDAERPATVAECFTAADLVHGFRMRYGGMTLRLLEVEIEAGNGTPAVREQYRSLQATYERWAEQAAVAAQVDTLPIRSLVGVQFGAILAGAGYAAERFGPRAAGRGDDGGSDDGGQHGRGA